MYPSRITVPVDGDPEVEDIFSSGLSSLFTDHVQDSHGTPGSSVIYHSPRFGDMVLRIPSHPDVDEGRRLFAHFLWNAGVIVADAIETASSRDYDDNGDQAPEDEKYQSRVSWDRRYWDVRGRRVLELGAGTALPSLISALSGATTTTITDHPSSPALTTGAIQQNVKANVLEKRKGPYAAQTPVIHVFGFTWGTTEMYMPEGHGVPARPQPEVYDRIIVADCLWMPSQHANVVKTIVHYLDSAAPDACALVMAGFHTGRAVVRSFLDIATGDFPDEEERVDGEQEDDPELVGVRGRLKAIHVSEIDVAGVRRPWESVRQGEDRHQARRWCVCAVLVKR